MINTEYLNQHMTHKRYSVISREQKPSLASTQMPFFTSSFPSPSATFPWWSAFFHCLPLINPIREMISAGSVEIHFSSLQVLSAICHSSVSVARKCERVATVHLTLKLSLLLLIVCHFGSAETYSRKQLHSPRFGSIIDALRRYERFHSKFVEKHMGFFLLLSHLYIFHLKYLFKKEINS